VSLQLGAERTALEQKLIIDLKLPSHYSVRVEQL
jgi:hypothetical protein